jgi:hypothetical protein
VPLTIRSGDGATQAIERALGIKLRELKGDKKEESKKALLELAKEIDSAVARSAPGRKENKKWGVRNLFEGDKITLDGDTWTFEPSNGTKAKNSEKK